MIIEVRTDSLKSVTNAVVEERFEKALPARLTLSPLAACWRPDVGELNQLISVWPYADHAEMERVHQAEKSLPGWPADIGEFVVKQESKVMIPAPFSPALEPRKLGNIYEVRTYTYPKGSIPLVIKNWQEILDARLKFSPLVGAWYAENENDSEWMHIWAYRDSGERETVRAAASKAGVWPPSLVDKRLNRKPSTVSLRMRNQLVVPTSFSPLH